MKILIYTNHRTGSTTLANFLALHFDCEYSRRFHFNSSEHFIENVNKTKNGIYKVCPEEDSYENIKSLFEKRIVLVRENILEQAESWTLAKVTNHSHLTPYNVPAGFFDKHQIELNEMIELIKKENEYFKKCEDCLYLTYEELYYSNIGLEKLENYLNIKFKFLLDNSKKFRNMNKSII